MKSRPSLLRKTNPKTYAATLSLVFIACALGGPDLDAQGVISTQPEDVTIKSGEAAVVTVGISGDPFAVQIYRIVPLTPRNSSGNSGRFLMFGRCPHPSDEDTSMKSLPIATGTANPLRSRKASFSKPRPFISLSVNSPTLDSATAP